MREIRKAAVADHDRLWEILRVVIGRGDVFAYSSDATQQEMIGYWCDANKHTYVALVDGNIAGTFFIQNNQPGRGSHVANAGYAVAAEYEGKGLGKYMAAFSLAEAKRLGYHAMQFNLVVRTNENAVHLWKKMGFAIIGEIPSAFNHARLGLTSAYIMYREL